MVVGKTQVSQVQSVYQIVELVMTLQLNNFGFSYLTIILLIKRKAILSTRLHLELELPDFLELASSILDLDSVVVSGCFGVTET